MRERDGYNVSQQTFRTGKLMCTQLQTTVQTVTILQIHIHTPNGFTREKPHRQTASPLHTSWTTSQRLTGEKGRRHHQALLGSAMELLEQEADNTRGVYLTH